MCVGFGHAIPHHIVFRSPPALLTPGWRWSSQKPPEIMCHTQTRSTAGEFCREESLVELLLEAGQPELLLECGQLGLTLLKSAHLPIFPAKPLRQPPLPASGNAMVPSLKRHVFEPCFAAWDGSSLIPRKSLLSLSLAMLLWHLSEAKAATTPDSCEPWWQWAWKIVSTIPCSLSFRTTFRGAGSSSRSGRAGACGRCRIIICISAFSFSASPFGDFAASCRRRSSFDCPFFSKSFLLSISLSIQAFRFFAWSSFSFLSFSSFSRPA